MFDRADRGSPDAKFECGVCWTVYDPAQGDPDRGVEPGVAFADLPEWWRCSHCDAEQARFLPVTDDDAAQA